MSETIREVCAHCGHGIERHFNDVTGVARCLWTERGTTDRGVIGLPFERRCGCTNFGAALDQEATHG